MYVKGDDANSRQFASLHGVQRHMVDASKCKMVFDDNEEEYEEFYDWSKLEDDLQGTVTASRLLILKLSGLSNYMGFISALTCSTVKGPPPCVHQQGVLSIVICEMCKFCHQRGWQAHNCVHTPGSPLAKQQPTKQSLASAITTK